MGCSSIWHVIDGHMWMYGKYNMIDKMGQFETLDNAYFCKKRLIGVIKGLIIWGGL